ncbi:MAG: monovalent cation/H+ antiporter subunit A [Helicobacteraceae bacterium]|nr:monovalent cation/H+ antiporter subunit A [Helicobacteraceae bacterium]
MGFEGLDLVFLLLLPFLGSLLVALLSKLSRAASAWGAGVVTLFATLILFGYSDHVLFDSKIFIQTWSWFPHLGLDFALRLDGLSFLFASLILIIGILVIVYARYYISAEDCMGRFYSKLLLFMGSMLGVVLSENILLLMVFWELTSLSSFLLISYWQNKEEAREGAKLALTLTGMGGLAMLGAMILLGHVVGSYNLTDVLASGRLIQENSLYTPIILLVLLGVFTKSAQFPFHFWLPHAMSAPTPVSAYLHSATMVKAGLFILARFYPVLSGTNEWIALVSGAGLLTLLLGSFVAFFKDDLKGLLAYSTISHLGLITLLFGFSTPLATVAALFHIINHATFKASLFMVAGIIDHESGTRDMKKLGGLFAFMPHTATLAMIAASAMAGVPLLNGFLSKEMFFERTLENVTLLNLMLPFLVTLAAIFSVAYSIRFIHAVFFGETSKELPKTPHEPPHFMKLPVDLLVLICFIVGTFPMLSVAPLLSNAVVASLQSEAPHYSLALWHGFTLPLLMSFIAFAGGILLYIKRQRVFASYHKNLSSIDARIPFNKALESLFSFARFTTSTLQTSSLQTMLAWLFLFAFFSLFAGLSYGDTPLLGARMFLPLDWISIAVSAILIISALATVVLHHKRLVALVVLGVIGLIISLIFVKFSAPDLALTQLSVEVVTVVLILLALYYLPQRAQRESSSLHIGRDVLIASLGAVGVFILTLAVLSRDYDPISDYYIQNALSGAGGSNIVNVILVDFRAFDTLGEISVLAIAGLGIFSMLQGLRLNAANVDERGFFYSLQSHPPMIATLTRLLFPLMLLVSVYIFLRGHNLPGGGFIAGLIAAVALIVQYLANGIAWTQKRLSFKKHIFISLGLLIATLTGLVPLFLGHEFLSSAFTHVSLPLIGEFELASALVFDIGVFMVVVGFTVLILIQLGQISTHASKTNRKGK